MFPNESIMLPGEGGVLLLQALEVRLPLRECALEVSELVLLACTYPAEFIHGVEEGYFPSRPQCGPSRISDGQTRDLPVLALLPLLLRGL